MKNIVKTLGLTLSLFSASSCLYANDAIGPGESDSTWVLGAGTVQHNNIYAGEDDDSNGFMKFAYKGENFFVKGGSINLHLYNYDKFSFGLTAAFDGNFLRDNEDYNDNAQLAGLFERANTIEGGFYIYHTSKLGRMEFKLKTDVADNHNGESASLNYTFDLKAGDWHINPSIGMNWISEQKVNHKFGVSMSEANDQRAAYEGSSALNYYIGVSARYEITENVDIKFNTGINFLADSIKNSSIVDDNKGYFAGMSFNYNF